MIPLPPSSPFPARALPQPPPGSVRSASLALERARRARRDAAKIQPMLFTGPTKFQGLVGALREACERREP